jgi:hypothetical protein
MKEEVDALSIRALASTDEPSGAKTSTLQVMRSELDLNFTAALETTVGGSLGLTDEGSASTCNNV